MIMPYIICEHKILSKICCFFFLVTIIIDLNSSDSIHDPNSWAFIEANDNILIFIEIGHSYLKVI